MPQHEISLAEELDKHYPGFSGWLESHDEGQEIEDSAKDAICGVLALMVQVDPLNSLLVAFMLGQWSRMQ